MVQGLACTTCSIFQGVAQGFACTTPSLSQLHNLFIQALRTLLAVLEPLRTLLAVLQPLRGSFLARISS